MKKAWIIALNFFLRVSLHAKKGLLKLGGKTLCINLDFNDLICS